MLTDAAKWAWSNRRKIVGVTVAAAGTYAAYVVWRKKCELQSFCEELLQEPPMQSRKAKVEEHFQAAQRESDILLARELLGIQAHLTKALDTEAFRTQMRAEGATLDPVRWNKFTLMITTRAIASLYAVALALLMRRVHMNIVARHYLLEKDNEGLGGRSSSSSPNNGGLNKLTKMRFLSRELGSDVLDALIHAVRKASSTATSSLRLDKQFNAASLQRGVISVVRELLEKPGSSEPDALAPICALLLDGIRVSGVAAEGDQLGALLEEVRRTIASAPFRIVLTDLMQAAGNVWTEQLQATLGGPEASRPYAKLLSHLERLGKRAVSEGENSVLQSMLGVQSLSELCWMIYSAPFCDYA